MATLEHSYALMYPQVFVLTNRFKQWCFYDNICCFINFAH